MAALTGAPEITLEEDKNRGPGFYILVIGWNEFARRNQIAKSVDEIPSTQRQLFQFGAAAG